MKSRSSRDQFVVVKGMDVGNAAGLWFLALTVLNRKKVVKRAIEYKTI